MSARYSALDVSLEETAICVIDEGGRTIAEKKVVTCPDVICSWLLSNAPRLARVGMETGPLAIWLWNELNDRKLACTRFRRHRPAMAAGMTSRLWEIGDMLVC